MFISTAVMALALSKQPTVEIIDSRTMPDISWVIVDDCAVPVNKYNLQDLDAVIKKVNEICELDLDIGDLK